MNNRRRVFALSLLSLVSIANAADYRENELTGIYRKSQGKNAPRIEIDGHGRTPWIEVSGTCLKDIPDGTRLWVKGTIKSYVQGANNSDSEQQQPTQWVIVMEVERCSPIAKPFGLPKGTGIQNK